MTTAIEIISDQEFGERAGHAVNPHVSVLVLQEGPDPTTARCLVARWREEPIVRTLDAARYMLALAEKLARHGPAGAAGDFPRATIFQAKDEPVDAPSASWQKQAGWDAVRLVPDLYYHVERGYEAFLPDQPDWSARRPAVVWRGSSTGNPYGMTLANLDELPRYRLCRAAQALGEAADVKLSGIVQADGVEQEHAIVERVRAEGVIGDFVPMTAMAGYRLIVDIDGNANSWNFMQKLRLGACVLRVESVWRQWFSAALTPWKHYVPVAADLSDFAAIVDWCLTHDREVEAIARQGRQFALDMRYDDEMLKAAQTIFVPGFDPAA